MSRYQAMFDRLRAEKEGAFIPFVVLYDPDRETSKKIMLALIEAGADALELGLAFSDPLADGPVIQKADLRALRSGSKVKDALALVKEIRAQNPHIPLGLLTYANLVFNQTLDGFYRLCHQSGIDSVVVADVPLLESRPYCEAALQHGVDPVLLAPVNLPRERCQEIATWGRGYTYVVTRRGVTGADAEVSLGHHELINALKDSGAPPAIFGFGIAKPDHIKAALNEGASGAISGSQTVSIIEEHLGDRDAMLKKLKEFVRSMKDATRSL
jgi:tryptophan synthase alpha chain